MPMAAVFKQACLSWGSSLMWSRPSTTSSGLRSFISLPMLALLSGCNHGLHSLLDFGDAFWSTTGWALRASASASQKGIRFLELWPFRIGLVHARSIQFAPSTRTFSFVDNILIHFDHRPSGPAHSDGILLLVTYRILQAFLPFVV